MDYIINPMWFYWLHICDGAKMVVVIFAVIIGCAVVGTQIWYTATKIGDGDDKEPSGWNSIKERKTAKPYLIAGWIVFAVLVLLGMFIPSRNTMLEMQIARYATKQGVEIGIDAIKSATDYVIEAIKSLK